MPYNKNIWVTDHTDGTKMDTFKSISTSCLCNPYCQARAKNPDSICSKCYANRQLSMWKSLEEHVRENVDVLTLTLLEDDELPVFKQKYFRFESFGDLHNVVHLQNYIKIAEKNPNTNFGLWTKNVFILEEVFEKMKINKPNNLVINASSPFLNEELTIRKPYIDHVFTVFDKNYIAEHGIKINCGDKHCINCLVCYTKNTNYYIRERLK